MAYQSGISQVIKFIPSAELKDSQPSTICLIPLTKERYDKYLSSLAEFKKNKFISHADTAFSRLAQLSLAPDDKGNYLYNFYWTEDGKTEFHKEVKDKDFAIKILCGMNDINSANEIEAKMKGESTLSEEEEKN